MRIKSWALFESYKEVRYDKHSEFNDTKVSAPFSKKEIDEVYSILGHASQSSFSSIGYYVDTNKKSLRIYKFQDDWYSVSYINPRYHYSKFYICDQFDELVDCLTMIKNKGWLSTNL